MGQSTQTEDYNTPAVDHAMETRLYAVLSRAGAPTPTQLEDKLRAVDTALRRFTENRKLWAEPGNAGRKKLQMHTAFTLFVPAGRADKARTAVEVLEAQRVLPYTRTAFVNTGLGTELYRHIRPYVRFPQQKAGRLAFALDNWDSVVVTTALEALALADPLDRHSLITADIPGYGDKAAAHFMRNTGLMGGMSAVPIIDVHIKKLLTGLDMVSPAEPRYSVWANGFRTLSSSLGIAPLLLDAIVWQAYADNYNLTHSDFDNFEEDNT